MLIDNIGDKIKTFEKIESARKANPDLPICIRLDGRSFHSFTKGMKRPFDERLSNLMIETTKVLVEETGALIGYTQSDEISLILALNKDSTSQFIFDGKFQKLNSVLSGIASGYFCKHLIEKIPEKKDFLPVFDCRCFQVPSLYDAYLVLLWREQDAIKNAISMAASSLYPHKFLLNINSENKLKLIKERGIIWENFPDFFTKGTFVQKVKILKQLTEEEKKNIPIKFRPTEPIIRSEIQEIKFDNFLDKLEDPLKKIFPTIIC